MARKIVFPMKVTVENTTYNFYNVRQLYDFYYRVEADYLTEFSRPFWREGINLTELVHFPEKFTIVNELELTK
jgi:hypothetical protein